MGQEGNGLHVPGVSDDRDRPVLADWANHPGHALMRAKYLKIRSDYYTNLGETLYRNPDQIAATDLREKAAFFRGALWILNDPVFERKALDRAMAQTEGDKTND